MAEELEQQQEQEPEVDATAGDTADESESHAESDTANDGESQPKKNRFNERISELVRQRNDARERAADMERRLAALEAGKNQPEPKGKPNQDDFKTWEDYQEALVDWKTEQKLQQERAREAQEAESARLQRNFAAYNRQVSEATAKYEDFEEVVGRDDLLIPQVAQLAIYELDNGAEVAYYLAKHPEQLEKLVEMNSDSLIKVVAEVTRISDRLKGSPETKRPVSNAPNPIKPVGGAATRSATPIDKLPFDQYVKAREKQLKEAGRSRR